MSFLNIKNYPTQNKAKKIKIGIICSGKTDYYGASSCIRLLSPLNEISTEYIITLIDNTNISKFKNDLIEKNIDLNLIIIQRDILLNSEFNDFEFINQLYEQCKKKSIRIIFDIDDDLLNIDSTHIDYNVYHEIQPLLKYILKNSNIITVPNSILKKQIKNFNNSIPIKIIPNTLIKSYTILKKNTKLKMKNTIKIGYFGGKSHKKDLKLIEQAIKNIMINYPNKNIIFEVVGVTDESFDWMKKVNIPNYYNTVPKSRANKIKNILSKIMEQINIDGNLPYYTFIDWMKNEINWDIGVAPLEDTNINRSKSNLKYLEYTLMNIPGVYSNIGPYKELKKKNTGLVVDNNVNQWTNAIITLIEDEKLYESILKNAKEDIEKNYKVDDASIIWKSLIEEIN